MKLIFNSFFLLFFVCTLVIFSSGLTGAYFTDEGSSTGSSFSAICWDNPATTPLNSPVNDTNSNATDITFMWTSTTSTCPIADPFTYNFQIYSDITLSTLVFQTGFLGPPLSYVYTSIPEGEYWWRVQAKDQYNNSSNSSTYHLIVDRYAPSASLQVEGSGYKAVTESLTNGGFESGLTGWTTAGTAAFASSDSITNASPSSPVTITPYSGSGMAVVGNASNYVWQNRLMQSCDSGAKSMSLYYNFVTRDVTPFDDPGFYIRINGQEIFRLNTLAANTGDVADGKARNTGWQQFNYNLSTISDSKMNLAIYGGNTTDTTNDSWVYIDEITTYIVTAKGTANYKITGTDTGLSGINNCSYSTNGGGTWNTVLSGSENAVFSSAGTATLQYYCTDNAGNNSSVYSVKVITDNTSPNKITDLTVSSTTENTATLTWTAPGNDDGVPPLGRASSYNIKYGTTLTDCSAFDFATVPFTVDKIPSPQVYGKSETLTVLGLNPSTTYCFAIQSSDEAPNTSIVSDAALGTTAASVFSVNAGDIIINEMMWSGSSLSANDEWIELRNMTDHSIPLDNFILERWDGAMYVTMATISVGKSIASRGYFIVSNFDLTSSQIKNGFIPAANLYINTGIDLSDTDLKIQLSDASSNVIDTVWDYTTPHEGLLDAGSNKYYSMERTSIPGDGTNPLNWYTCIDQASTADFFDVGVTDERGTPGTTNRSENESLANQTALGIGIPTLSPIPPLTPFVQARLTNDNKGISFTFDNVIQYNSLSYEITYDSASGQQGVIGQTKLDNQQKFEKSNVILGTCSTGGTCVYHQEIKNIKITVTLVDEANISQVMTKKLP